MYAGYSGYSGYSGSDSTSCVPRRAVRGSCPYRRCIISRTEWVPNTAYAMSPPLPMPCHAAAL